MALEIQTATSADAPALAEVFFAAFSDDFNRTMFPPTPDVRAWIAETLLTSDEASGRDIILKATDPADSDAVVAFAKWVRPSSSDAHADPDRHEGPKWPAGSDAALCDLFFGTMDEHHEVLMEERPHYCKFSIFLFLLSHFPIRTVCFQWSCPFLFTARLIYLC